ncbi:protein c9orf32, partial [Cystoisospora suis]
MGDNSLGRHYASLEEAWKDELGSDQEKKDDWYRHAADYWEKKEASVRGMLDGYDAVSSVDVEASLSFLDKIKSLPKWK